MEQVRSDREAVRILDWDDAGNVGIASIDRHHRGLLEELNKLFGQLMQGEGREAVPHMAQLIAETIDPHFAEEEALMRRYYWAAKAVTQLNQILLLNIAERLQPAAEQATPINDRFYERAGLIEIASEDLYEREPNAILETFLLYQPTIGVNGLSPLPLPAHQLPVNACIVPCNKWTVRNAGDTAIFVTPG